MRHCSTPAGRITACIVLVLTLFSSGCLEEAVTLTETTKYSKPKLAQLKKERQKVIQKQRRIIFNNDGADHPRGPETPEAFLAKRIAPLMDTQVDTICYSTSYSFRAETYALYSEDQQRLEQDTLETVVDYCHKHKKEVFWSMRMNETLDSNIQNGIMLNDWKIQNRDLLMAPSYTSFPYGWVNRPTWPWTAMNYEEPKVRDHIFEVITDVCVRYDIDGIELDFWRWPVFFKNQLFGKPVTQAQLDMMTDLMKRIRKMSLLVSDKRNRPLLIAVRIPDSVGYAREVGIDLMKWLDEDLVDINDGGGYFQLQPWDHIVKIGAHFNVPVYACLSRSRIPDDDSIFRGEAMEAWKAGVTGVYTFNYTNAGSPLFNQIGDPVTLKDLPRTDKYRLGHMEWRHIQRVGTIVKGGEKYFAQELMNKWEGPIPEIIDGINVGFEPGQNVQMVYTNDRYKLAFSEKYGTYKLFDIVNDPKERKNLSMEMPHVFEPMKNQLDNWRKRNENILYNQ